MFPEPRFHPAIPAGTPPHSVRSGPTPARGRGDLPAGPPPGAVADIGFGTLGYRLLATREPLDEALIGDLVRVLTAA
ncbi:hypothetical protein Ssi03_61800 [Sphaerisporangium siamense]|uniref:Tetracyclin repressor-like C-terminal domain-containing protein n=1 Tax=Sphaerisporangium siamense TaxID=795645 RepID=A0A7W7D8Z5_9ACTN|nr:TetR-like C-terminal domain-containing protein [Sphaerisporangium siamense]MBB4702493.1 hypothetical protein [Sphaerisporangium siamense]GII88190.1 hypothetical protein Ssi03_61800 [Sphaerisporangium siamense]